MKDLTTKAVYAVGTSVATIAAVIGLNMLSSAIYSSPEPKTPGFLISAAEAQTPAPEAAAPAAPAATPPAAAPVAATPPAAATVATPAAPAAPAAAAAPAAPAAGGATLGARMATADATKGATVAKACLACHDMTKGGPNKVGPNQWNIVGRPIASHEGFKYSEVMKALSGKTWTYEELDLYIADPKTYAKGNKMAYAGIKKEQDRADLLAYLATLSDQPVPPPAP